MKRVCAIDDRKIIVTDERDGQCFVGIADLDDYRTQYIDITIEHREARFWGLIFFGIQFFILSGAVIWIAGHALVALIDGRFSR